MYKFFAVVFTAFILTGCATTAPTLIKTEYKVIRPPAEMLTACPAPPALPDPAKLTDVQVARAFLKTYGNNQKCYSTLQSVKRFLNEAEKITVEEFKTEGAQ